MRRTAPPTASARVGAMITLPRALLGFLRAGGDEAEGARARLMAGSPRGDELRAAVTSALAGDLRPTDRALTRWLLEQETAALTARGTGATEALYSLVAALARFGQPTDGFLLWRARQATAETRAGVDVEQLARAGLDETRAALGARAADGGEDEATEARAALAWLDEERAAGAFADLAGYFAWSDERYGIKIAGPT